MCDQQVVCLLMQDQADICKKPLAYTSRMLIAAEQNYDTTQRKFLAVVLAINVLRSYLGAPRFTICTEHDTLEMESQPRGLDKTTGQVQSPFY